MNREQRRLELKQKIAECEKTIAECELEKMDLEDEKTYQEIKKSAYDTKLVHSYSESIKKQLPTIHDIRKNGVFEIGHNQQSINWDIHTIYEIKSNISSLDGSLKAWEKLGTRLGITGQWCRILGYGIEIGHFDKWIRKYESINPLKYDGDGQLVF